MNPKELDELEDAFYDAVLNLPGVCGVGLVEPEQDGDLPYLGVVIRNESVRKSIPETIQGIKVNIVVKS